MFKRAHCLKARSLCHGENFSKRARLLRRGGSLLRRMRCGLVIWMCEDFIGFWRFLLLRRDVVRYNKRVGGEGYV